jgi:hypothetical protein
MVCLRNISVDTLHKGNTDDDDNDDDDDDDNNNNNNNNNNNSNMHRSLQSVLGHGRKNAYFGAVLCAKDSCSCGS